MSDRNATPHSAAKWWQRKCRKVIRFTYADVTRCNLRRGHTGPCDEVAA